MERENLTERFTEVNRRNPFVQHNHIEIVQVGPDRALLRLVLREESLNPHGLVHGGALFTLADNAAGCAASSDGRAYVTQASDFHFLRTLASGTVFAEALVQHRGRSTVLVDVKLTDDEERLLAEAIFTFFCVDGSEIARNSPVASGRLEKDAAR